MSLLVMRRELLAPQASGDLELFNAGVTNPLVTGWGSKVSSGASNYSYAANVIGFHIVDSVYAHIYAYAYTTNKIDVTKYKKLYAEFYSYYTSLTAHLGLTSAANSSNGMITFLSNAHAAVGMRVSNQHYTLECDVSAITGAYFVALGIYKPNTTAGTFDAYCPKIWLKS